MEKTKSRKLSREEKLNNFELIRKKKENNERKTNKKILCNASSGPMINTTRVRAGWVWTYSTQASLSRPHEFPTPELFVGNDGGVGSVQARC